MVVCIFALFGMAVAAMAYMVGRKHGGEASERTIEKLRWNAVLDARHRKALQAHFDRLQLNNRDLHRQLHGTFSEKK